MSERRVLIVDFSADSRNRPFGSAVAAALPAGVDHEIVRCDAVDDWGRRASEVSHLILSGSDIPLPRSEAWFEPTRRQVRTVIESGLPVFGICFGHQLIVQSLGAPDMVRRADVGEFGITELTPLPAFASDPVVGRGLGRPLRGYNLHADEVVAETAVPALGLTLLARSEACAVQAYHVAGRPVWGVQFHPELTGEAVAAAVAVAPLSFGQPAPDAAAIDRIAHGPSCRHPGIFAAFLAVDRR
ncbi:type 1 glutamine amidotransferase [Rhodospirillaceae bacterium SYSU D60014]|uniref:type 1 glutamine amidotransferase n=1 Tax=Virgifigura deserti TaxID=2268457 RepID=UPI000E65F054